MASCANCCTTFKKKKGDKGYYRFSIESNLPSTGKPAREHLGDLTGGSFSPLAKKRTGQFLCPNCWNSLSSIIKYNQAFDNFFNATGTTSYIGSKRQLSESLGSPSTSFKRPRFTSTPLKHKSKAAKPIFAKNTSKWDTIITAIRARKYRRAILGLYKATAGTKRHFAEVASRIARQEIKDLMKKSDSFSLCKEVNLQSISEFSWENTIARVSETAPFLFNVLKGSVTTRKTQDTMVRGSTVNLKPRIGLALSILLHAKYPRKCSFLPTILSVQFWRGHLKRETIKQLGRLGLCVGYETTLKAIDVIRANFDSAALKLKSDLEECLQKTLPPFIHEEGNEDLSLALSVTVPNMEDQIDHFSDMECEDTLLYSEGNLTDSANSSDSSSDDEAEDSDVDKDLSDEESSDETNEELPDISHIPEEWDDIADDEISSHLQQCDPTPAEAAENMDVPSENMTNGPVVPGFTMCWDNVGKKVITRRPTETVKNRYINMALGYMSLNRVSSQHLNWLEDDSVVKASDIPIDKFVPALNDNNQLKYRMGVIVGRIITRHLKWFRDYFSDNTTRHIVHEYSLESTRKSLLLNLGVFNEDPSSTQGAIGIYNTLQKYIPVVGGKPYTAIVYGDGLSCERGNDAHRARSNGLDPLERLEGLEPAVQEFHKEMLLLQDFYDEFYKSSSASDRGTLCQLKNMLNFRQVKPDISDNFSHAWELMSVTVEGSLCLLLMQMTDMEDYNSRPASAPDGVETASHDLKQSFFDNICNSVVEKIWKPLDTEALLSQTDTVPPVVCCGEDIDEDMIGCECRSNCPRGEFFHYTCAGVDTENIPVPWYCSLECRDRPVKRYQYCNCQTDLGTDEPMVGCSAEGQCTRFEWYHMRCVGIDPLKPPKKNWFCCDPCKETFTHKIKVGKRKKKSKISDQPDEDFKANYSLGLLWFGLNLFCRRDAVREADGEAMMSYWKFDLVHFFSRKHPKYVILAHRLLAAINGWLPAKLRFDLVHNRTVNYGGGIGRNLPMDFMNEILNRLFKDLLDSAKGRYTDITIQRCSQIVGPLGEALDSVFDSNLIEHEVYRHRYRAVNRDENVSRVIEFLQNEELFACRTGRIHSSFPGYAYKVNPSQAGRFSAKMSQLSKRLDRRKKIIINQ